MTIFAGFLVLLHGYSMGDSEVLWQRRRFQTAKIVGAEYPDEILSKTLGTQAKGTLRVRLWGWYGGTSVVHLCDKLQKWFPEKSSNCNLSDHDNGLILSMVHHCLHIETRLSSHIPPLL